MKSLKVNQKSGKPEIGYPHIRKLEKSRSIELEVENPAQESQLLKTEKYFDMR